MEDDQKRLDIVKENIQRYPDFPKPGIVFM